ncbi:hypothetical protein GBA52_018387 [Prunus armeniaca]|nr:hypothetical protein GBA52_018387 [Prunus armeniaca]
MSLCIVLCINGFAASPLEPRSRHNLKASLSLGTSLIALIAMVFRYITIKTTRTTDPDIIVKAKQLVELLPIRIPVNEAIRVVKLSDMHCDIIQLGEINGLGSKFAVTPGQYSVRLGRLMHYLHVGYSEYDYQKEMIVVIGSPLRLQVIRKIMVDAIVHDVDPSPRVNSILTSSQAMVDLKDLHL